MRVGIIAHALPLLCAVSDAMEIPVQSSCDSAF